MFVSFGFNSKGSTSRKKYLMRIWPVWSLDNLLYWQMMLQPALKLTLLLWSIQPLNWWPTTTMLHFKGYQFRFNWTHHWPVHLWCFPGVPLVVPHFRLWGSLLSITVIKVGLAADQAWRCMNTTPMQRPTKRHQGCLPGTSSNKLMKVILWGNFW